VESPFSSLTRVCIGAKPRRGNSFADRFTVPLRLGASNPGPRPVSPFSLRLDLCVNRLALRPLRLFTRHFWKNLVPSKTDLGWKSIRRVVSNHMHLKRPTEAESGAITFLQRLTYLAVVFLLFPLIIITRSRDVSGDHVCLSHDCNCLWRSTIGPHHSLLRSSCPCSLLLVHIAMVCLAGFKSRMRAMITGRNAAGKEPSHE